MCENGGPAVTSSSSCGGHHHGGLSIPLPLPRSISASLGVPTSVSSATAASSCVAPPRDGEMEELTQQIDSIREQLKAALARRAELQTTLAKERANAAAMAPTGSLPLAVPLPSRTPPAKEGKSKR